MREPVGDPRRQITDGQGGGRSKNWLGHVLEAKINLQNFNINTDKMQTDKPWVIKTRPPNNISISFASINKAAAVRDQRIAATDGINNEERVITPSSRTVPLSKIREMGELDLWCTMIQEWSLTKSRGQLELKPTLRTLKERPSSWLSSGLVAADP